MALAAAITALANYFGAGGAGAEWLYAPIAVAVLGTLGAIVNANTEPEPTNQPAQARGADGTVTPAPSKMQRFLLG